MTTSSRFMSIVATLGSSKGRSQEAAVRTEIRAFRKSTNRGRSNDSSAKILPLSLFVSKVPSRTNQPQKDCPLLQCSFLRSCRYPTTRRPAPHIVAYDFFPPGSNRRFGDSGVVSQKPYTLLIYEACKLKPWDVHPYANSPYSS